VNDDNAGATDEQHRVLNYQFRVTRWQFQNCSMYTRLSSMATLPSAQWALLVVDVIFYYTNRTTGLVKKILCAGGRRYRGNSVPGSSITVL